MFRVRRVVVRAVRLTVVRIRLIDIRIDRRSCVSLCNISKFLSVRCLVRFTVVIVLCVFRRNVMTRVRTLFAESRAPSVSVCILLVIIVKL